MKKFIIYLFGSLIILSSNIVNAADKVVFGTNWLAQGGHGCISVTGNVAPKLCSDMHLAWRNKDIIKAQNRAKQGKNSKKLVKIGKTR